MELSYPTKEKVSGEVEGPPMANDSILNDLNVSENQATTLKDAVKIFLRMYHEADIKKLFLDKNLKSLKIDYYEFIHHLEDYGDEKNYDKIFINKPEFVIKTANNVLNKVCKNEFLTVRIDDMPINTSLKELESKHIGSIISTTALIKNVSDIRPTLKMAMFECMGCMRLHKLEQKGNSISEPALCEDCGGRSFKLLQEESEFTNSQIIKLEEPLESRTGGTTRDFKAYLEGDLADPLNNINPGDVVNLIGILKIIKDEKTKEFNFIFDINNIIPVMSSYQDIEITDEDENEIKRLSRDPNIFSKITNSIATSLSGHTAIKQGLALQQFGAYEEQKDDKTFSRGSLNILIIGDPGVGKSQFLKYISNLSPKGIYASGATSSSVGLTAAAVRDEFTGNWTIEAGTMVLANGGTACIDELDKLSKKSILSLNEAIEQGSVSVAKAGLVQTMNAKTSLLAAANPKYSSFTRTKEIREQIQIPDSTLSRFDLIFAIEDKIEASYDMNLANSILKGHSLKKTEIIDQELLTKYIAYSRKNYIPRLREEAIDIITDFYVKTREVASYDDDSKPVTPRDLEAIKRLTIARARIDLVEHADVKHAQEAIQIYADALDTIGLRPETAGDLSGAKSKREIDCIKKSESLILNKKEEYGDNIPKEEIEEIILDIQATCGVNEDRAYAIYKEARRNIAGK